MRSDGPPPAARVRRRRLAALGVVAALAAASGVAIGAGEEDEPGSGRFAATVLPPPGLAQRDDAPAAEPARTLTQEAGRTIVLRFAGTSPPAYVLRALRERRAAGVILFRDNVVDAAQVRRMTRALTRASRGRALVMIDQEGGAIRNLPWAPPSVGQSRLTTAAAAAAAARAAAGGLRDAGVNVNLAPVADVGAWPGSVMRTRAFPGAGPRVAELVAASVRAYRGTGVLPTVKHFPGLGRSRTNTDFAAATVPGGGDLEPFRAAIRERVPLVMSDHAVHPELDRTRIASQSRAILTDLLRGRLGFRGVVITDSLEAKAVVGRSSTPVAAERSMRAGADLLLTTGRGSYIHTLRRLTGLARRDAAFRRRLAEARGRVEALRRDG